MIVMLLFESATTIKPLSQVIGLHVVEKLELGGVDADGGGDDEQYTLNLQVWRSSPTVDQMDSGDYSPVGNNRFTSIFLSSGVAVVTPSPQDLIQFQPGDVLGFYVEEARDDNSKGVVILTTASYTNELPVPLRQWLAVPSQLGVVEI